MSKIKLPMGWVRSRIGDVVQDRIEQGLPDDKREFTYIDISAVDNRRKEIVEPKTLSATKAPSRARQQVKSNDVLVSTTRPNLNAVALVPPQMDGAIASTGFAVLRPVLIEPRWLFSVVQSEDFVSEMSVLVKGALYPAIRPSHVHDYEMLVPPLAEQKRITTELTKLLKRTRNVNDTLEALPELIQQYRLVVLEAAYTGRLVPTEAELARKERREFEPASVLLERLLTERRIKWERDQFAQMHADGKEPRDDKWKERYPVPHSTELRNQTEADLPEGWLRSNFGQLLEVERGRFMARPRNDPRFYNGVYPFVQIGDLPENGGLIRTYTQTLNQKGLEVSRMFPRGTVLIAIVGSTIGNTGVLDFDSCCPDSLVAFQSSNEILRRFTDYYLRLERLAIRKAATGAGGQPNINLGILHPWPMPLPPLAEQRRIVAELDRRFASLDAMEAQVESALKETSQLRSTLFHRALSGKLLPQNQSDEPASELLLRIRKIKHQRAKNPKVRGATPHRLKLEKLPMLTLEDIEPTHLADILHQHGGPLDAKALWKESQLTIDDFYAQLKKELGKSLKETGKNRLLEVRS